MIQRFELHKGISTDFKKQLKVNSYIITHQLITNIYSPQIRFKHPTYSPTEITFKWQTQTTTYPTVYQNLRWTGTFLFFDNNFYNHKTDINL